MTRSLLSVLVVFSVAEWLNFFLASANVHIDVTAACIVFFAAMLSNFRYYIAVVLLSFLVGFMSGYSNMIMMFAVITAGLVDWSKSAFDIRSIRFVGTISLLYAVMRQAVMYLVIFGTAKPSRTIAVESIVAVCVDALIAPLVLFLLYLVNKFKTPASEKKVLHHA